MSAVEGEVTSVLQVAGAEYWSLFTLNAVKNLCDDSLVFPYLSIDTYKYIYF
jgi:hypothetical protein